MNFLHFSKRPPLTQSDPAFTYRGENLAHALGERGYITWAGNYARSPLWQQNWDAVVFHRPRDSWQLHALISWLGGRGSRLVADFDDLVFDPAQAVHSPGVVNGLVSLADTQVLFKRHLQALRRFDCVTVSTEPLADHVRRLLGLKVQVIVVPNALHWSWRRIPAPDAVCGPSSVGYLPGTRSHDRDFASVAPGLQRVLARHPKARLSITGPLEFSLPDCSAQVQHRPRVPFERYHEEFRGLHLNIAPLENSPFNECKSAIKVMEAAWWGIPTLCSRLPDAMRFKDAGALIADTPAEFEDMLADLLDHPEKLAAMRQGLRERVLPLADIHAVAAHWLEAVLGQAPSPRA